MQGTRLEMTLEADVSELGAALDAFDRFAEDAGVCGDDAFKVRLAVDELVNNVIDHGYPPGTRGEIRLRIERLAERLTIDLVDDAVLFDPFQVPTPDLDAGVDERPLGGLGVHLIRSLMTEARYTVDGGRNHVRLVLDLAPP